MAKKVSISEVKSGAASIDDLLIINALLDMQSDMEQPVNGNS